MPDFKPQDIRYAKLVDRYSRYIHSPVSRLKFLNAAMSMDRSGGLFMRVPLVGSLPERAALILELSKVLPADQPAPLGLRLTSLLYRLRYAVYGLSLAFALLIGAGVVYTAARIAGSFSISTMAESTADKSARPVEVDATGAEALQSIGSEAGLTPDKVWLAESGEGYEFYSNGARVLTGFETAGEARAFYRIPLEAPGGRADDFPVETKPVGILYHLSEGDLLPFAGTYNSSLQTRSKALLEYARDNRLYNYIIDRFGRIYRIVGDEFVSNHAGNSVWGDGKNVFINLNPSFIGVCFEGRSGSRGTVGAEGINEAQIYAARVLTAVLRSKHQIEDANCVTHGLVSVNPSNKLMGYHTDWVADFPFAALGLSDKYAIEIAAISRFGFDYDQAYVKAAGGRRWAGLERADQALAEEAQNNGVSVDEERRARYKAFQDISLKQRSLGK